MPYELKALTFHREQQQKCLFRQLSLCVCSRSSWCLSPQTLPAGKVLECSMFVESEQTWAQSLLISSFKGPNSQQRKKKTNRPFLSIWALTACGFEQTRELNSATLPARAAMINLWPAHRGKEDGGKIL